MAKLLITGGRQRRTLFRKLEEWHASEKAVLIELDPSTNASRVCVEYISPASACPDELPAIVFKSASLWGNRLYTCTSTEVLVYRLPEFELVHYISLPCFNDLHHVCPTRRGTLLVAVTGLDMVVEVTTEGEITREWSVIDRDPWQRFSRHTDYRQVASTKPHQSHPNHVFELDGQVWVTRFEQRDSICLTSRDLRIEIAIQRPHDGYMSGDMIYFTTVDGHIVIANRKTLQIERVIDLAQIGNQNGKVLGWCRGVLPIDRHKLWVAFTRVRPTKFIENVSWIKHGGAQIHQPSHLALYDLERNCCEQEIDLESHGLGLVFSILPAPSSAE